jgi:plastocyanin
MRGALLLALACGCSTSAVLPPEPDLSTPPDASDAGASNVVHVAPFGTIAFVPKELSIHVGDTVHWIFDGDGHNVSSGVLESDDGGMLELPDGKFCFPPSLDGTCTGDRHGPAAGAGSSFDFTFAAAGAFPYFCGNHFLTGTITVQ